MLTTILLLFLASCVSLPTTTYIILMTLGSLNIILEAIKGAHTIYKSIYVVKIKNDNDEKKNKIDKK